MRVQRECKVPSLSVSLFSLQGGATYSRMMCGGPMNSRCYLDDEFEHLKVSSSSVITPRMNSTMI